MAFQDDLHTLAINVANRAESTTTEEAAKQALVLPFLRVLGYDVFNPEEVVPEYTADVGMKKGEKVDYAILKEGEPIILIECKATDNELTIENASQLYRYFGAQKAPVAILTNGVVYKFYSDLKEANKMDDRPFFEFSFLDLPDFVAQELERFCSEKFDADEVVSAALDLKYTREIKSFLKQQLAQPESDFVIFLGKQVNSGHMTKARKQALERIVSKAMRQFVDDQIRDRLKLNDSEQTTESAVTPEPEPKIPKVDTTEEEIEVYQIVRAILRQTVDLKQVVYRDAQSYFSILLDDNNRKPICRFKASSKSKRFATVDENHKDTWHEIITLEEIFNFADQLLTTAKTYQTK